MRTKKKSLQLSLFLILITMLLFTVISCDTVYDTDITGNWWTTKTQNNEKVTVELSLETDGKYSWKEFSAANSLNLDLAGTWSSQENVQETGGASFSLNMLPTSEDDAVIEAHSKDLIFRLSGGGNILETFRLNEDSTFSSVYYFHRAKSRGVGIYE